MDEFEDSLEKIADAQREVAKQARDLAASLENQRQSEQRAKTEACLDFYQKYLQRILETINNRLASGNGHFVVFAKGLIGAQYANENVYGRRGASLCVALVWNEDETTTKPGQETPLTHSLGFEVEPVVGNELFETTVFVGRKDSTPGFGGSNDYGSDDHFSIPANPQDHDFTQIKEYFLDALSNSATIVRYKPSPSVGYTEKVH